MANTVNVPNPAGQTTTKLENAESGFKASETLAANLQKVLVDFIALELVDKHAHWNIVGPNFTSTSTRSSKLPVRALTRSLSVCAPFTPPQTVVPQS